MFIDFCAFPHRIKIASLRTFQTNSIFPFSAQFILCKIKSIFIAYACSLFNLISFIAAIAPSICAIPCSAQAIHSLAFVIRVKVPPGWTLNAIISLPLSTSDLPLKQFLFFGAWAIKYLIALIAAFADSFVSVKCFTLRMGPLAQLIFI